jgi:hypothetical protein
MPSHGSLAHLAACTKTPPYLENRWAIALAPTDRSMAHPKLKSFRRIVVKVGSSLLIDSAAGEVRATWLAALAADIAKLHDEGRDVLIVSSGAIALGRSSFKLPRGAFKF